MPFGLAIIDLVTGNIIDVNQKKLKLTCFEKENFVGQNFKNFINAHFKNKTNILKVQLS